MSNLMQQAAQVVTSIMMQATMLFGSGATQAQDTPQLYAAQYSPSQQNAYIFGENQFDVDYSLGYVNIQNSTKGPSSAIWAQEDVAWYLPKTNYLFRSTQKTEGVYLDHYNQAKYKDEWLDVREYVWVNRDTGIVHGSTGAVAAQSSATDNWVMREFHFYKAGTLKQSNPIEVQFKGIMQLTDLDLGEGYTVNNVHKAYLWKNTSIVYSGNNTWKGTYEGNDLEEQSIWVEVDQSPQSPLRLQYWAYMQHSGHINYGGTVVTGTLTYKPNGAPGNDVQQVISLGYDTGIASNPYSWNECDFLGWNTSTDGSGTWLYPGSTHVFTSQQTLYAQWKHNYYTVKFNGTGATSGQMNDQTIERGVNTPLNKNQFVREFDVIFDARGGAVPTSKTHSTQYFVNWDLNGNKYTDTQGVLNLAPANSWATLYAQWEDKYILLPEASKPGYVFDGWYMTGNVGSEKFVGGAGDRFLVDGNYTLYAKYVKPVGTLVGIEDSTAANNHGGVNLAWNFTNIKNSVGYTYKVFQAQADEDTYGSLIDDPTKWSTVQLLDLTKETEPIYVLNIVPAQEFNFGEARTGEPNKDMRRTYTLPEYDWDGYPTGNTYKLNMVQFAALKVWMEGGVIDVLHTYKTSCGPNGVWETTANPLQYNVQYEAYGASPYTNQQVIRVIPVYIQDINKNPSQYLRYDDTTKTWKIKVNMNALYDPNGREVELSEIFIGSRDQNGSSVNAEQASQSLVNMIQKFLDTGGQVVAGHDTIGWDRSVDNNELHTLRDRFKIWTHRDDPDKIPVYTAYGQTDVVVTKSGIITNFPYELKLGTHLTVPFCHTINNSQYGTVWMEFNENNLQAPADDAHYPGRDTVQGNPLYYLTTSGNTAMIQTGHSGCESTSDERKIIANLLFYLKQTQRSDSQTAVDNSAQDFEAPDAVDDSKAIVKFDSQTNTSVTIQRPNDNGTWYTHVVQLFKSSEVADEFRLQNGNLATQNFVSTEVISGTQGYYMYIDDKQTGSISYVDGQITQDYGDKYSDNSANLSSLQTFKTIYKQDINVEYKDTQKSLSWGGNISGISVNNDSQTGKITILNLDVEKLRKLTNQSNIWIHIVSFDAAGNVQQTSNIKVPLTELIYNANGGVGEDIHQAITPSIPAKIQVNTFTKNGYRFANWNTKRDGTGSTYLENKQYVFNETTTLYAQWIKLNYLTVNPNGGSWTDNYGIVVDEQITGPNIDTEATMKTYTQEVEFLMGPTDTKNIEDANRDGYNFSGWQFDTEMVPKVEATLKANRLWKAAIGTSTIKDVTQIHFVESLPDGLSITKSWDPTVEQNKAIMAYLIGDTVYVVTNGNILYANSDQSDAFQDFRYIETIDGLQLLDTSKVTDMTRMFYYVGFFSSKKQIEISGMENWNTSNVTDMSSMFEAAGDIAQQIDVGNIGNWNVSKVKSMNKMFKSFGAGAEYVNLEGIGNWNLERLTDAQEMFCFFARKASTVDLGDLSNWNTSSVTNMNKMFSNYGYQSLEVKLKGLGSWDVSNVTDMAEMFQYLGCNSNTLEFDRLDSWKTGNVTDMHSMFEGIGKQAKNFSIGDLSNWDTSSVTNLQRMFQSVYYNSDAFDIGDLSNWDVSNVTDLSDMFYYAGYNSKEVHVGDLSNWDTSEVTDISYMFSYFGYSAQQIDLGDLGKWETSKVTNMGNAFYYTGYKASSFNIGDLSDWNTSNVENMGFLFGGIGYNLKQLDIGDLLSWDTSKVANAQYMFRSCRAIKTNITIMNPNMSAYNMMFNNAATAADAMINVYYGEGCKDIAQACVDTKSQNQNVYLVDEPQQSVETSTLMSGNSWYQQSVDMQSIKEIHFVKQIPSEITELDSWDPTVEWYGTSKAVIDTDYSLYISTGGADTIKASQDASYMFSQTYGPEDYQFNNVMLIDGLELFDTQDVTNASYMFQYLGSKQESLNIDLSNLNIGSIDNMQYMFSHTGEGSDQFSLGDLGKWNTSKVTNMEGMFEAAGMNASTWSVGNLKDWDLSNVDNLRRMFYNCKQVKTDITIGNPGLSRDNCQDMLYGAATNSGQQMYVYAKDDSCMWTRQYCLDTRDLDSNIYIGF